MFFDGTILQPVRFREAISALHEVVVGDLKFKKKDKTAYRSWQEREAKREEALRHAAFDKASHEALLNLAREAPPENLQADFQRLRRVYWRARTKWMSELALDDPAFFRALVPSDPVVTVAPDVVFFECFAKDESAYGCLTVKRDAFRHQETPTLGTTNVDYSLPLYQHFQTLRSYRPTRLLVDPAGFEVNVGERESLREEKIDLPPSWLRGFGQLQAAMTLPAERVELSVDVVHSVLAYLKRHREKTGPRSIRFRLEPGKPPAVVLDPWGVTFISRGKAYEGVRPSELKVWGRRRLFALSRLLPLAERFEVLLLGSGLPSVWMAHLGEMRFTLALSGWTANDWTSGTNLDQTFAGFDADERVVADLARYLESARVASMATLRSQANAPDKTIFGSLQMLAKQGQVAYDFSDGVVRYRPIMPAPLSTSVLGPEPPEVAASRELTAQVTIVRDDRIDAGKRLIVAKVSGTSCEGLMDADGKFGRAKCSCSFFHRFALRAGPCRHLIALRTHIFRA